MSRRLIALLCLLLPVAAMAQGLPPPAAEMLPASRIFCDHSVHYRLVPRDTVPPQYRRFIGAWSDAAWNAHTCAALVVQNVRADGAASILYVYGPLGSQAPARGGVLHGTGVIRGGELRFQNSDGSQFAFRPGIIDLDGQWTTPSGKTYEAIFKQTP